ncbi:hypothetical protein Nepgr_008362 [Nepenthes gracilis]|uniref:GYF domain-containing protein n=1 Tax=Nepenthes gracilis TaxID=150966 RepID=A0AAD3XJ57_NEPGR|nr:hypothetical protein Nepgr_008362 [Nepenthes gracilis]
MGNERKSPIVVAEQPSVSNSSSTEASLAVDRQGLGDAERAGEAPVVLVSSSSAGGRVAATTELEFEVKGAEAIVAKRKRGRPRKCGQPKTVAASPSAKRFKKEEEDVCFICFDGGTLVLCDRRDCPKVYHPACVKRDEAFFRGRVRWNCGWHICNSCQRNAHFMCYTCSYSLCKGCVKQAEFFSIKGNKGFCGTCMATVMLIENSSPGNKELGQVDFDDMGSWEYLFKIYWIYLKQKECLTLDDLKRATNTWKGSGSDNKYDSSQKMSDAGANKAAILNSATGQLEANVSKRRKIQRQTSLHNDSQGEKMDECRHLHESIKCGVSERMTMGEIQETGIALQSARANELLESEILRLNHVCDHASEMGHQKKYPFIFLILLSFFLTLATIRECAEKLELLNTPEDQQHRLHEIPEVHSDPRMDPRCESNEDAGQSNIKKQDVNMSQDSSSYNTKGMELISPQGGGDMPIQASDWEHKRNTGTKFQPQKVENDTGTSERDFESSQTLEGAEAASRILVELRNGMDRSIQTNNHAIMMSADASVSLSMGIAVPFGNLEAEKIWHYRDPSGKIQGPFCMSQLRKWSSNGFFPTDLRIWRINESQDQSILLTDVAECVASIGMQFSELQGLDNNKCQVAEAMHSIASNVSGQGCGTSCSTVAARVGFSDLPSTASKQDNPGVKVEAVENKHFVTSSVRRQDSAVSWSTAAPTPESCELTPPTPTQPDYSTSRWHGMEPIELSTLGDESVSDLLSEVEALESLNGTATRTSLTNCAEGSISSPGNDCFKPLVGMSMPLYPGYHDAPSSSCDIRFHPHPITTDGPCGDFPVDVNDLPKTSVGHSSVRPREEELNPIFLFLFGNEN